MENCFLYLQQGEQSAFNFFFNNYYQPLVHFAFTFLKDTEAAEDVVEDCFLKLWERREIITSESSIKPFLYKTVRNACIDILRKQVHSKAYVNHINKSPREFAPDAIKNIIISESMHQVHLAFQNLPSKYKQIFAMLWVQGKEVKEIAAELNLPVSTVKSQKQRVLELIRNQLPQLGSFMLLFFFPGLF